MTNKPSKEKIIIPIVIAAVLWFFMFSPWTKGITNFWITMSVSAIVLTSLALHFSSDDNHFSIERPVFQLLLGIFLAFALWGLFWIGDKLSTMMFSFARPEVDAVYSMKEGLPIWLITTLLLFIIGPAEEFFCRGFIQREMAGLFKKNQRMHAFWTTVIVYSLIHIWSMNFMLVMAAFVAGFVWGIIYRFRPQLLPALIVSHALWDVLVFVVFPI